MIFQISVLYVFGCCGSFLELPLHCYSNIKYQQLVFYAGKKLSLNTFIWTYGVSHLCIHLTLGPFISINITYFFSVAHKVLPNLGTHSQRCRQKHVLAGLSSDVTGIFLKALNFSTRWISCWILSRLCQINWK